MNLPSFKYWLILLLSLLGLAACSYVGLNDAPFAQLVEHSVPIVSGSWSPDGESVIYATKNDELFLSSGESSESSDKENPILIQEFESITSFSKVKWDSPDSISFSHFEGVPPTNNRVIPNTISTLSADWLDLEVIFQGDYKIYDYCWLQNTNRLVLLIEDPEEQAFVTSVYGRTIIHVDLLSQETRIVHSVLRTMSIIDIECKPNSNDISFIRKLGDSAGSTYSLMTVNADISNIRTIIDTSNTTYRSHTWLANGQDVYLLEFLPRARGWRIPSIRFHSTVAESNDSRCLVDDGVPKEIAVSSNGDLLSIADFGFTESSLFVWQLSTNDVCE